MGLRVSGCISDTQSEIHSWAGQQTRNHILQMSPAVVACHEALSLPQLLVVCWLVELSSVEQVRRAPVHVCVCVCVCVCMHKERLDIFEAKMRKVKRLAVVGNRTQDTWLVQPVLCH